MNTTVKNSHRFIVGGALIAVAAVGAGLAVAHAGTLPASGNTIAMTIDNNTDETLTLNGAYLNIGDFIAAPQRTLAPHSSEIVTAGTASTDAMAAVFNYEMPDSTLITFEANSLPDGANTNGTIITGTSAGSYSITTTTDTGYPHLNASYTLQPKAHA